MQTALPGLGQTDSFVSTTLGSSQLTRNDRRSTGIEFDLKFSAGNCPSNTSKPSEGNFALPGVMHLPGYVVGRVSVFDSFINVIPLPRRLPCQQKRRWRSSDAYPFWWLALPSKSGRRGASRHAHDTQPESSFLWKIYRDCTAFNVLFRTDSGYLGSIHQDQRQQNRCW
jgi:hypothetical protein